MLTGCISAASKNKKRDFIPSIKAMEIMKDDIEEVRYTKFANCMSTFRSYEATKNWRDDLEKGITKPSIYISS